MKSRRRLLLAVGLGVVLVLAAAGVLAAVFAVSPVSAYSSVWQAVTFQDDDDDDEAITGEALEQASAAALEYTGGGRVTDTEIGDEEGYYEVEVTLDDGRQVDVHLDQNFNVLGQEVDGDEVEDEDEAEDAAEDEAEGDDAPITGDALEQASAAALAYVGEGRVTDTEVGDEEGYYEVEITLDNGRQVDVHLDQDFNVLSQEADGAPGEDD